MAWNLQYKTEQLLWIYYKVDLVVNCLYQEEICTVELGKFC